MGNTQSASSTRTDATPREVEMNGSPSISTPSPTGAIATTESKETLAQNEEDTASRRVIGKRRSLMKFPSLRKRPRSVAGLSSEAQDDSGLSSPPPSRRRWRAFSGLKSRPASTIADTIAPATDEQPSEDIPTVSTAEHATNDKGKEREAELAPQECAQPRASVAPSPEHSANAPEPALSVVEEHETAPEPAAVLRDLRELQEAISTGNSPQRSDNPDPQVESDSDTRHQADRPLTPMPASAIDSVPESQEGDPPASGNHAALVEALGSWMSGRARREHAESTNDAPFASSSRPWSAGPSAPHRPLSNIGTGIENSSDFLGPFARNPPRPPNALGMSPGNPPASVPNMFGRGPTTAPMPQDRHTLPPTGTGTLVVVQGVVHTTDVRHAHPPVPSTPHTAANSSYPPRSTSSTPTLRTASRPPAAHTSSRASTPQPQPSPLRGRFSSLTNSLRPRSRPETPSSLRNPGIGGWRQGLGDPDNGDPSETASERSVGLGLGLGSSASDSETAPISTSPFAGVSAPSDASVMEPSHHGQQNASDEVSTPDDSQAHTNEGDSSNAEPGEQARLGDSDVGSEDEGEAELSASSIEVLGTLLSVATAATAASLVTGTTDPLFSSGLAGSLASPHARSSTVPTGDTLNASAPPPFRPPQSPPLPGLGTDSNNPEAAVNTRMRAAWESLRDRFSRTRGRRGGSGAEAGGEGREDPREQMLREMAMAFNMGLGLGPDGDRDRWEQGQEPRGEARQAEATEPAASEGTTVPETPPSLNEAALPESASRTTLEPGSPGPGPEGSFERFLHNLQVDLRTALTEDYAARRARAQQARGVPTSITTPSNGEPVAASSAETNTTPFPPLEPSTESGFEGRHEDEASGPTGASEPDRQSPHLVPTVPNTPRAATLDLPSLPGTADSRPQDGPGSVPAPAQAQGITGQPGAGINWWRLYRFPPMQLAPHPTTGNVSTPTAAGVPVQPRPAPSERLARPSSTEPRSPLGSGSPGLSSPESQTLPAAPSQNVVPVIVVGLQSVPVNRAGAHHHHHHHEHPSPFGPPPTNGSFPSFPSSDSPSEAPGRDRAWPLRAASRAFGRRGRRNDAEAHTGFGIPSPPEDAGTGLAREGRHGGRTYLIFVIGGYYPPNHSIVTGADDMNSFEALWELAELLGQVKPPVASKEDIAKSGLEIIKASSLSNYEKAGKVASNTVERCLICLDDYDPQDDLRLLSCRHVFHKQCVDKWLEQGRNNCPACRTKGVSTGDGSPVSPTPGIPSGNPLGDLD